MNPKNVEAGRLSISACMIVKNEEKMLPQCLKSIKGHVDEIVIVDTGSTDGTIAIAESFGARVYHHPWEDNFAKHRNQSFGYAQGDWILIIDADEELYPIDEDGLRKAVYTEEGVDGIAVMVECAFDDGNAQAHASSVRLIRNHAGIHYAGRVHNYLVGVKKAICTPIQLLHHGYNLDKDALKRKFERTTKLLRRDIEDDPTNPRPHHFLSASYLSENMFAEASAEAEKAISLYESQKKLSHNYLWSLYIAAAGNLGMGQIDVAQQLAEKGINFDELHLDSHYLMAAIGFKKSVRIMFDRHMTCYLDLKEFIKDEPARFGQMVHNTYASQWLLHLFKGFLLLNEEKEQEALLEFAKSQDLCPDIFLMHSKMGAYFFQKKQLEQAEKHYLKALQSHPHDSQAQWALALICGKRNDLAGKVSWLEKILDRDGQFPNAHFELGLAKMEFGDYESARLLFQDARSLAPKNQIATINEALCLRALRRYDESIRLFESIEANNVEQNRIVMTNLALCYYESGNLDTSLERFEKMAKTDPESLTPPVYLSKLYALKREIEACVFQCDKLMSLLELDRERTIHRLVELGGMYIEAGHRLAAQRNENLAHICFEVGAMLGCQDERAVSV